ncbi:MAG TPA: Hsp20/alpha crystallin family protein [Balneolales bacterium]|nr:Hsp20/alpha crystallin family protein [Balneolales bacterium]
MRRSNRFPSTDPFSKIQNRVHQIYDDLTSFKSLNIEGANELNFYIPKADIKESDQHYMLIIELPGLKKNEINVTVDKDKLVISGERTQQIDPDKQHLLKRERQTGSFQRYFTLPDIIDASQIKTKLENGELTLTIPKSKTKKSRTIEIK